ncbi:pimeloyl-ACP methyl ester carboxylesterase [Pararhizobium capsulatum DSM 1112]|uniref:Pimeloyl-ACP methyl ester carboxylesterase n=1 Tax=Pararhizobium capsulatum DSM 1112 TaxID=1121113 RepID=A0ABU0BN29_9HYPH|nr:alpha/beta hydrolase [Pararhizobium capsulatum]MDQ0319661.1 pimeloyl-ACP methyl ester carboxylesterase [Pararhizobium capsulatum DSM 1112]
MAEASKPDFVEHFVGATDGISIYVREYGSNLRGQTRLPIVCLAGLSRNSRDFHELAVHLSMRKFQPRQVIALDYRGRGKSDWDPDSSHYQLPIEAQDVVKVCEALGIAKANFIGTSRGGLILHLLAATNPALLNSVILNDIGPVIEHAGLLHIRDYLSSPTRFLEWKDAVQNLKHLHGDAFPVLSEENWEAMAYAIYRHDGREIIADYDPALADALKNLNAETSLPDMWPLFEKLTAVPLLVIRGERSTILSGETLAEMIVRHPNATAVLAKGQGHAPLLHLDEPAQTIERFLDALT